MSLTFFQIKNLAVLQIRQGFQMRGINVTYKARYFI